MFAEVAVNSSVPHRGAFTYSVPPAMDLRVGQAVYVPFGPRTLQGVVMALTDVPSYPETKDVGAVIDPRPLLSPQHVALAQWMAQRYLAPLFDCVALMLPPGFSRRPATIYRAQAAPGALAEGSLASDEAAVLALLRGRGPLSAEALERELKLPGLPRLLGRLRRRGLVSQEYELSRPRVGPKLVLHARLLLEPPAALAQAQAIVDREAPSRPRRAQAEALRLLAAEGPLLPLPDLRARAGLGLPQARELATWGAVALEARPVERDPLAHLALSAPEIAASWPVLTPAQEAAFDPIAQALELGGPASFLLHGVTGSGKTEIYLRALERAQALGRRGIVLVPEIALTPQTIRRFAQRFPGRVAVIHSGLSPGQLYDQWRGIGQGRYAVVIGARSALFTPQPELGLIVIDEEHESTYKQQESAPGYHAREVAEEMARLWGAVLVLGSATPALESYHRALEGRYRLLELPQRAAPGAAAAPPLPAVEVVDMRQELRAGQRGIFSRRLLAAMSQALARGEQVILFLNRRGSAFSVQCRECGHALRCPGCGLAFTYHGAEGRLLCHHCRRQRLLPDRCPQCGGPSFRPLGLGTQRVEEEVQRLFPKARPLRWDRDVVVGHADHERLLSRFLRGEADVLVGTQMVAKGLDLPRVGLVGVVLADIGLNLPDYRSAERSFQLLTQVAGRAGRRGEGRVIIQTYSPGHYAIVAAAKHDYRSFYQQELAWRRRLGYPPFTRLARLVYAHTGADYAQAQAGRLGRLLRERQAALGLADLEVRGPAPAFIAKVRGRYRWQILLRGSEPEGLLAQVPLPAGWAVEIDPVTLL